MDAEAKNTDREIWRRDPGSYYSPSIHVTEDGRIGIDVDGHVIGMEIEGWHKLGQEFMGVVDIKTAEK